jgi:HlyD family secretion protein
MADASGTFEAKEIIVSSELSGRIRTLELEEGQTIPSGKVVGTIDATNLQLQLDQVTASIQSLQEKTADVKPQVNLLQKQLEVQQSQLQSQLKERTRLENLVKADAATGKQLDDMDAAIDVARKQMLVTQQQINVQKSNIRTQNRGILSESNPLRKRADQLTDQMGKASIVNPVAATVLLKFAENGEVTAPGKALYKIADLTTMIMRAYITGMQLPQVKLNQPVTVLVDKSEKEQKQLTGTVTWISDKAEFTPKTIQTKDERENLVYAVKISVPNDGYLKIGMYGEVLLNNKP